jgi:hypothetical protein
MHVAAATLAALAALAAAPPRALADGRLSSPAPLPAEQAEAGRGADPAQEPEVALRLAAAPGFGSAAAAVPVEDAVALQFPIQLDLGWRVGAFTIGAYGSWAPARPPRCPSGASCSASAVRLGVQGTWTFEPSAGMQGWLGAGTGWERATSHVKRSGTDDATSYSGLELFQVQSGLEWRLHRRLALGPYLQLGLGRYSDVRVQTKVESASASIADRAVHAWLYAGVRARVPLGGPW